MPYAESVPTALSQIPVIDVRPLFSNAESGAERGVPPAALKQVAEQMRAAAESVGFFYVTGHGIADDVLGRASREGRAFFSEPSEYKDRWVVNQAHHGYLCVGEARMEGAPRPDLKESFVWGRDDNRWPQGRDELRDALEAFFSQASRCAVVLMQAFATAMRLAPDAFTRSASRPISRGSCIYYPPQAPELGREQFGVAPHTDYGCLTLVWQDQAGLEVQHPAGHWVEAPPIVDTLVVNVGDLLARWTNDAFRSTPHRVINREGRERLSLALFWDPDADTLIDPSIVCDARNPAVHPPVTCGAYIADRYDGSFSYRNSRNPS